MNARDRMFLMMFLRLLIFAMRFCFWTTFRTLKLLKVETPEPPRLKVDKEWKPKVQTIWPYKPHEAIRTQPAHPRPTATISQTLDTETVKKVLSPTAAGDFLFFCLLIFWIFLFPILRQISKDNSSRTLLHRSLPANVVRHSILHFLHTSGRPSSAFYSACHPLAHLRSGPGRTKLVFVVLHALVPSYNRPISEGPQLTHPYNLMQLYR